MTSSGALVSSPFITHAPVSRDPSRDPEALLVAPAGCLVSTAHRWVFADPSAALRSQDRCVHFKGVKKGEACTIVLRGASSHVLDEAERSLHDALCVLQQAVLDARVVPGGGYPEIQMAQVVEEEARKTTGKSSLGMEAFASALRNLPAIICDNAGMDSAEIVAELRAAHAKAKEEGREIYHGVDVVAGTTGDMRSLGVFEAFKVKQQVLLSATEAAEMILRVDDIIKAAPRQRE